MALFDQSLTYSPSPALKDRILIGKTTLNEDQKIWLTISFIVGCIILPITAFILTGFNFIVAGIVFVLADMIWEASHYFWSVIIPHRKMQKEVLKASKDKIASLEIEIKEIEAKNGFVYNTEGPQENWDKAIAEKEAALERLTTYLKFEKVWVDEKLTQYKQEELEMMQKPTKEYEEKRLFFAEFKERLEMYISKHKLTNLKVVLAAMDELTSVLDKRPNSYELIPTMFYVYVDELQKIVAKICKREQEHIELHMQDLTNVANALSQNIYQMIERIHESETTEIDIGLSVLLKELGGEEVADVV